LSDDRCVTSARLLAFYFNSRTTTVPSTCWGRPGPP